MREVEQLKEHPLAKSSWCRTAAEGAGHQLSPNLFADIDAHAGLGGLSTHTVSVGILSGSRVFDRETSRRPGDNAALPLLPSLCHIWTERKELRQRGELCVKTSDQTSIGALVRHANERRPPGRAMAGLAARRACNAPGTRLILPSDHPFAYFLQPVERRVWTGIDAHRLWIHRVSKLFLTDGSECFDDASVARYFDQDTTHARRPILELQNFVVLRLLHHLKPCPAAE